MHYASRITGDWTKQRLTIKGFPSSQAMHEFLNKQTDNTWGVNNPMPGHQLKPGTYVMLGGKWTNIRKVDASVLAHC